MLYISLLLSVIKTAPVGVASPALSATDIVPVVAPLPGRMFADSTGSLVPAAYAHDIIDSGAAILGQGRAVAAPSSTANPGFDQLGLLYGGFAAPVPTVALPFPIVIPLASAGQGLSVDDPAYNPGPDGSNIAPPTPSSTATDLSSASAVPVASGPGRIITTDPSPVAIPVDTTGSLVPVVPVLSGPGRIVTTDPSPVGVPGSVGRPAAGFDQLGLLNGGSPAPVPSVAVPLPIIVPLVPAGPGLSVVDPTTSNPDGYVPAVVISNMVVPAIFLPDPSASAPNSPVVLGPGRVVTSDPSPVSIPDNTPGSPVASNIPGASIVPIFSGPGRIITSDLTPVAIPGATSRGDNTVPVVGAGRGVVGAIPSPTSSPSFDNVGLLNGGIPAPVPSVALPLPIVLPLSSSGPGLAVVDPGTVNPDGYSPVADGGQVPAIYLDTPTTSNVPSPSQT